MIIYKDLLNGDELLADSYDLSEVGNGFFYEVEGKWQLVTEVDVDIGANPSAEGGDEEEGGGGGDGRRVVDLVDSFRLTEQPSYDKKAFTAYLKPWLSKVVEKLPDDQKDEFKAKAQPAFKFLMGKIKELQFFMGESMDPESTMVYAYYKEGASNPTFLYPKYALKAQKM